MEVKIPHMVPVRMISSLQHADGASCACVAYVDPDSPFVCGDALLPEMLLEIMAQCFAAGSASKMGECGGFLVGINSFRIENHAKRGEYLYVKCDILRVIGQISLIIGKIYGHDNRLLASSEFKIYIEEQK